MFTFSFFISLSFVSWLFFFILSWHWESTCVFLFKVLESNRLCYCKAICSSVTLLHILDMKDSGSCLRTVWDYLPQREFKGQSNVAAGADYSRCGLIQQNRRSRPKVKKAETKVALSEYPAAQNAHLVTFWISSEWFTPTSRSSFQKKKIILIIPRKTGCVKDHQIRGVVQWLHLQIVS